MEIAVISDLHLGPADCTDSFGHDDAEFLKFLRYLENNFEKVVLLGDIWETLTARALFTPAQALDACRRAHTEISRRFQHPKYLYIHGNHDIIAGVVEDAPEHWQLKVDGKRILFTHGHMHDLMVRRARWLSEFFVWLGGWLRRAGLSAVYRTFERIDYWRSGATPDPQRCSFQRWAMSTAQQRQADIIVTGHTHIPAHVPHGNRLFLNSGSCSDGRYSFLALDTKRDQYRVCNSW